MPKKKKLCSCPLVYKLHFASAHKHAKTLAGLKKSFGYRVGYIAGLNKAAQVLAELVAKVEMEEV